MFFSVSECKCQKKSFKTHCWTFEEDHLLATLAIRVVVGERNTTESSAMAARRK